MDAAGDWLWGGMLESLYSGAFLHDVGILQHVLFCVILSTTS